MSRSFWMESRICMEFCDIRGRVNKSTGGKEDVWPVLRLWSSLV